MWECVQASNVDHDIVIREVIKDVTQSFVAECKKARESHCETCDHRDECGVVRDSSEAVHRWLLEGPVDEKAVMVLTPSQ